MKFGKLPFAELDGLDLSIPPDHPRTPQVIAKYKSTEPSRVYIGCAKWGRSEWLNLIYPKGTKDKDFLAQYVTQFNAIELNGTFYNAKKVNIEKWTEIASAGFKFCPKYAH